MKYMGIIALVTTTVGAIVFLKRLFKKREITVTNLDDEVLVSIKDGEVISHESVKVYVDLSNFREE